MFLFLALRNIVRNKKNNAVIALLIAVITFLFFIGNSIIGRADRSIREAYIDSLTGDVVIQKAGDVSMNLFGANTPIIDSYFTIPVLPAYDAVMELVSAEAGIAGITSQVSGKAYLDMLELREPVLLCGIDAVSYFSLFPGIILEEGGFLRAGEYGAMITLERAERIKQQSGQYPAIGTPMLLTAGGAVGFKIREVPLLGIFSYQNPGQLMNEIVIIDPQTVRVLNSIQVAGSASVEVGEEALRLLAADPDAVFEEYSFGDSVGETGDEGFSEEMLWSYLNESASEEPEEEIIGGDWNFIIIQLKEGVSSAAFIASLNEKIGPYGLVAVNWRTAAGISAILLTLIQALFNAGVFLVSIAGIITAINILLIAVFRRTREIGTLRAIGASDSYIRLLILGENFLIALAAGLVGVMGGMWFLRVVNRMRIVIPNELIASLLGGVVLRVGFLPHIAVFSFGVAVILGITASVYPVEIAVRIEPIAAVRRG
ncbi:MAG: FtsX-like permease family protein [Treponema sp.]|jgi:ABC-type lipoprotein release transport system permease subunit|nr:FtsX-like permease family protein [Treponema sp.]